uniref:Uncharacterized protein n=1 Tax=Hucho hucho TaxID=62062 RepID=A0A4W5JXJ3_9TELE
MFSQVQDIEFVQIEMKVIEGLKVGNDCLKSMHEAMSLEDVERIMDETQDAVEYQRVSFSVPMVSSINLIHPFLQF